MSGAGAGKGLLARCICNIAFGRDPHAVIIRNTIDLQLKIVEIRNPLRNF